MPILEVKDIRKSFGGTEVLKGITFSLEQGESLSVIGSSGSGKTTLLRCLNFLERPDAGSITRVKHCRAVLNIRRCGKVPAQTWLLPLEMGA